MLVEIGQCIFRRDRINGVRVYGLTPENKLKVVPVLLIQSAAGYKCVGEISIKCKVSLAMMGDKVGDMYDVVNIKFIDKKFSVGSDQVVNSFESAVYEMLKPENSSMVAREIGLSYLNGSNEIEIEVDH